MESNKIIKLVSELVGVIRREGLNAIEASDALEEARRIYLSRCEHAVNTNIAKGCKNGDGEK